MLSLLAMHIIPFLLLQLVSACHVEEVIEEEVIEEIEEEEEEAIPPPPPEAPAAAISEADKLNSAFLSEYKCVCSLLPRTKVPLRGFST